MDNVRNTLRSEIAARLSAAPDSAEKAEMIEELSDNLYERCQERLAAGVSEEQAVTDAMTELGDVGELLAWLNSAQTALTPVQEQTAASEGPEGLPHSLVVETGSMDVLLCCKAVETPVVEYSGSPVMTGEENGVLYVREQQTASSRFLARRLPNSDGEINITLPIGGHWERVQICTANGDICVQSGLHAARLLLKAVSGDIECCNFTGALTVQTRNGDISLHNREQALTEARFKTFSGDIQVHTNLETLWAETTNGDVEIRTQGQAVHSAVLHTTSGDILFQGDSKTVEVTSTNGDVELNGQMEAVQVKTVNGDVDIHGTLLTLTAHTTSGDVELHLSNAPQEIAISSIAGDIELDLPPQAATKAQLRTMSGEVHMHSANIILA